MGPQVGFYGGINYGNGYFGSGFNGGRWEGGVFRHNTVISNVDRNNVHNTYEDRSVVHEAKGPNHAFNGKGGIKTQPSRGEVEASRAPHQGPTPVQVSHAQEAHNNHLEYIRSHNLQDPENKTFIKADENLKHVFDGKDRVSMFEMTKLVSHHVT